MLENLRNILGLSTKFYLLGVTVVDKSMDYYIMLVKLEKGELIIEKRGSITSFKDLNGDIPVLLHLDGDNVINKVASMESGYRNKLVFGANTDDFLFHEYYQDNEVYVSIARKSLVQEVLSKLSKSDLMVVHLAIGPFIIAALLNMIKGERSLYLSDCIIETSDGKIVSFSSDGVALEVQEINGEQLNFREIPLMAIALAYMYPNKFIGFDSDMVASNREDFKYKKLFKTSGILAVILIMGMLITGHFLKAYYSEKLVERTVEYSLHEQTIAKINSLRQEKELKEKILLTSGINKKDFLAKYISEIGNTVPHDIKLISLDIMSPQKKVKPDKKVTLSLNIIDVEGETTNDDSFNEWIDDLRELDWIKAVNIEYREDLKVNNTFSLKVKI